MNPFSYRAEILQYAQDNYGTTPEYLWARLPDAAVLRHKENGKWYALIMSVARNRLTPSVHSNEIVDIINLKCSPLETGSLLCRTGIFPAYHMNKTHWISVTLDGTVALEELYVLLHNSYQSTSSSSKQSSAKHN